MKIFLKVVLGFILLLVVTPVFLSNKFSMSRSIEIAAPVNDVFVKLTDLNEYVKWNPFPNGDPSNTATVSGEGLGASLVWKGDKTGEGKMTISEIDTSKSITIKMEFYKPMSGEGLVKWITSAKSESTTEMIWTFEQDLSYFQRYFGLFMDKMMGEHFERGLLKFKGMIEASK